MTAFIGGATIFFSVIYMEILEVFLDLRVVESGMSQCSVEGSAGSSVENSVEAGMTVAIVTPFDRGTVEAGRRSAGSSMEGSVEAGMAVAIVTPFDR